MNDPKLPLMEDGFWIFESSMNKGVNHEFEILESSITFANKDFSQQVQDEMKYYGMDIENLSKTTFISKFRLGALISGNANYEPHEIEIIRKRLHF